MCELVARSFQTLCNPMDCSLPGFSVHGIFQARILEWVDICFFRGSSWSRDRTWVSHIAGRLFTVWVTREAHITNKKPQRLDLNTGFMTFSLEIFLPPYNAQTWHCWIAFSPVLERKKVPLIWNHKFHDLDFICCLFSL